MEDFPGSIFFTFLRINEVNLDSEYTMEVFPGSIFFTFLRINEVNLDSEYTNYMYICFPCNIHHW